MKKIIILLLIAAVVLGTLPFVTLAASVSVSNNVIDITDVNVANAVIFDKITISGASVVSAEETSAYNLSVVLASNTAAGTKITATFSTSKQNLRPIVQNNTCTLNANGEGTMTAKLLATPNGSQIVGQALYTITFSIQRGAAYDVTLPESNGFSVVGNKYAYEGDNYNFTVSLNEGYKAGADFAVKVNGETIGTAPGSFTVSNIDKNLAVTVEGVVAKETYSVTLPTGEGYTVSGNTSVYEGNDYTFTVAISNTHKAGADFAVKVNGETIGTAPDSFTVSNVDKNLAVTVEGVVAKETYSVTLPTGEGYTVSGNTSVYEGNDYTFTIAISNTHKAGADFAVKVNGETIGTAPGSFTVSSVDKNLAVTVEGVVAKETYTVTLPTGEGYTVSGNTSVYEGDIYTFTVTISKGYKAGESFAVKVNGKTVGNAAGSFTVENISENLTITVEGVEDSGVEPTVILSGGRKPHSSWGYVDKITIDQVQVEEFVWIGDHAYITLNYKTAVNATAMVTFVTGGSRPGAMPDTLAALEDGIAEKSFTQKTTSFNYTWSFTLHFSNVGFVPTLASGVESTAATTVYTGDTYSLDLDTIFYDLFGKKMSYSVKVDDGEYTSIDGSIFTLPCSAEGTKVLTFKANNGKLTSEDTYTVTLTTQNLSFKKVTVLIPEAYTPIFYTTTGFDTNGADQLGKALETIKGETTDGLTAYTVTVDSLSEYISVRVEGWGGMAIASVADSTVTLRPVVVTMEDSLDNVVSGSYTVTSDGKLATSGNNGRFMLAVGPEYTMATSPSNTTNYQSSTNTYTLSAGTEIDTISAQVSFKNLKKIVTPTDATAQLFRYNQYYNNTEFACLGHLDNGNGTITHYFAGVTIPTGGGTTIYRVTYQDYIVKAGWSDATSTVTVTYSDSDLKSDARVDYSTSTFGNKDLGDDSLVVNVNSKNFLSLSVNSSYTLKAYRTWEIIPVSYNNWIIEPDFHFNVVWESEEGIISLSEVSNSMTGGESWCKVKGSKEGTAIIEVTYDAIDVRGSNSWSGVYGASDPSRTALVVVQVGGTNDSSVKFGIDCFSSIGAKSSDHVSYNPNNAKEWDAEFDTLYFVGESGSLTLNPSASGKITEVAVSNDKGSSWTVLTSDNGTYTATIKSGNNIIRVTTENGTSYQVVRGDQVTYTITEVSDKSDNDGLIEAGETVRVTINGLHMPIPKMSGNYNPGYGGNTDGYSSVHINYSLDGTAVWGVGTQYTFQNTHNYIEITIPENATDSVSLSDGYIGLGIIGLTQFVSGGDSHRNIPDGGCTTRGSESTWHTRCILPEITIELDAEAAPNTPPSVKADAPTQAELHLSDESYTYAINLGQDVFTDADAADQLTYTVSVNGGEKVAVENGYYTFVSPEVGTYTLLFTANDGKDEMQHTITLLVSKVLTPDPEPEPEPDPEPEPEPDDGIKGYVFVSFEDFGVRVPGETGLLYPNQLGTIVYSTEIPFYEGDTIADVTLRLLDSKNMTCQYSGSTKDGFYLGAIGNFYVGGIFFEELSEFDAGQGSGWMITWNDWFINQGASQFTVSDGDVIIWQYTCQYGRDIGDPYWDDDEGDNEDDVIVLEKPLVFTDVNANEYYYDALQWAVKMGITIGTSETTFSPNAKCTRAQMVTFLWRAAGEPKAKTSTCTFTDVDKEAYYYEALLWAVECGITNGTSKTTFSPDAECTRAQMVTFLYRSAKNPTIGGKCEFNDVKSDVYYYDAVVWAYNEEITNGTAVGIFNPDLSCTRAQMVTFLYRYLAE